MSYKTSNPALSEKTFKGFDPKASTGESMSLAGTANKAMLLLALTIGGAAFSWLSGISMGMCVAAALAAFVVGIVLIFNQRLVILAPVYAILEGIALGGVSALYEAQNPGIVVNCVGLTFGTLGVMLLAYRTGIIKATENFKLGIVSATGAVALLYLVDFGLVVFGGYKIPFIHEGGFWGIAFSLAVVALAAFNLVLDFDFIETGVERKAPKYMEWYSAFGLLVTLCWLYLELLRLYAKAKK